MKVEKIQVEIKEYYSKLQDFKNLCRFFENATIKGHPEKDVDNFKMLEEIHLSIEDGDLKEFAYKTEDDVYEKFKSCKIRLEDEEEKAELDYEHMVMSCETHLNPRIHY